MFLLLYADDTAILAESPSELQLQLDCFSRYCSNWKLKVNVNKTKVVIFTKGRIAKNIDFVFNGEPLEIVNEYKYLGIIFSRYGSFINTEKYLAEKATNAMYGVLKKARMFNLSIDCQLDLFDKIVVPILLYGSEVWGFGNLDVIEKVHLSFCKMILGLKQTTPKFIVYGELGRYPPSINIKLRMVKYWIQLLTGKQTKYCTILYNLLLTKYFNFGVSFSWINVVKSIFDECGMSNIFESQYFPNINLLVKSVKQRMLD